MAQKSSFFNSVSGDRKYNADNFARYFGSFIGNGVYPNPSTNLAVSAAAGMNVSVAVGKGFIDGYFYENTTALNVAIDAADGVLKRIDRVVLRLDQVGRQIILATLKGVPASTPAAKVLTRNVDTYELALADVYIDNGVTSILQGNITDQRLNTALCGIVHGVVDQVDTTAIFTQYQAALEDFETVQQAEFTAWVASMQEILDETTAGNLLSLILAIPPPTVIDNTLTSTSTTAALSAAQGKVLKDLADGHIVKGIDTINGVHGLRYYQDVLSFYDGFAWIEIKTGAHKTMGITIDLSNSNPATCVAYTDDAVGMTAASDSWDTEFPFNLIKPCVLLNGVVQYYLNPLNFAQKADLSAADITSGSAGDVMIEIPKMAYLIGVTGNYLDIKITENPDAKSVDSRYCFYGHSRASEGDKSKLYVGAYFGWYDGSSKLRSLSGKAPAATQPIGTFRTRARASGTGYDQLAFYQLTLLQCLYLIRYKNLDSQTALGRGYVDANSAAVNTGGANTRGMNYGEATGKQQMKFLGIEDFWGNLYSWIDGLFCDASRNILTAFQNFSDTGSGYSDKGSGGVTDIGGYMSKAQGTSDKGFIGKEENGSATTYYADSADLHAGCLPLFGGNWSDASLAGAFRLYVGSSASSSSASVGGRLMYL